MKSVAGRQVPFTPKQFPIRLSRRVGLRHMSSVGAKRLVCPSGEQIVNGGFETGDFTGWTGTNLCLSPPPPPCFGIGVQKKGDYWTDIDAYEGTYYCGTTFNAEYGIIEQTLINPVPVSCFTDTSIFLVHALAGFGWSPAGMGGLQIEIIYTDDTMTTVNWETTEAQKDTWQTIDLKPYLETGKTVSKVRLTINPYKVSYTMVDGISCKP